MSLSKINFVSHWGSYFIIIINVISTYLFAYQLIINHSISQNAGSTSDPRSGPGSGISSGADPGSGPGSSQEYRRYTDVLGFLRGELEALRIVTRRIEMHQARAGEVFGDISGVCVCVCVCVWCSVV